MSAWSAARCRYGGQPENTPMTNANRPYSNAWATQAIGLIGFLSSMLIPGCRVDAAPQFVQRRAQGCLIPWIDPRDGELVLRRGTQVGLARSLQPRQGPLLAEPEFATAFAAAAHQHARRAAVQRVFDERRRQHAGADQAERRHVRRRQRGD